MAHHHGGHHHCHHYHHYGRGYGSSVSLPALLIMLGIVLALMVGSTMYYASAWNNGYHKTCGSPYTYRICEECGYIEDIYCRPCGYHLAIPEWYELEGR